MIKNYYENDYFKWQKKSGLLTAKLSLFKFEPYISDGSSVLEFGCGGGFLLEKIRAQSKKGIEINPIALKSCLQKDLDVTPSLNDIPNSWADVVVSNHVLEHVESPVAELTALKEKMKSDAIIVFVVPNEKKAKYDANDINKHLYTWTELNLGNLFNAAGFEIIKVEEVKHRWFPFINQFMNIFGVRITHLMCGLYGVLFNNLSQIRIVAKNKV